MPAPLTLHLPRPLHRVEVLPTAPSAPAAPLVDLQCEREHLREEMQRALDAQQGQLQAAAHALREAAQQLLALQDALRHDAESALAALALDIANAVVMDEIESGRSRIAPLVRIALQDLPAHQPAQVHLHPEDLAASGLGGEAAGVTFVANSRIPRGGVLVETPHGTIESSPAERLARLGRAMKGEA